MAMPPREWNSPVTSIHWGLIWFRAVACGQRSPVEDALVAELPEVWLRDLVSMSYHQRVADGERAVVGLLGDGTEQVNSVAGELHGDLRALPRMRSTRCRLLRELPVLGS